MTFESNKKIWDEIKSKYQLEDEDCSDVMERASLLVHGIAALLATSDVQYTDEQIISLVETTLDDMAVGAKERKRGQ